jgi:hypothetical protein
MLSGLFVSDKLQDSSLDYIVKKSRRFPWVWFYQAFARLHQAGIRHEMAEELNPVSYYSGVCGTFVLPKLQSKRLVSACGQRYIDMLVFFIQPIQLTVIHSFYIDNIRIIIIMRIFLDYRERVSNRPIMSSRVK